MIELKMDISTLCLLVQALDNEQARLANVAPDTVYAYRVNGLANQMRSRYDLEMHLIATERAAQA